MKELVVNLGDRSYPIFIEPEGLKNLGQLISNRGLGKKIAVISDTNVAELYGDKVIEILNNADIKTTLHIVPAGEESKSMAQTEKLYTQLIQSNLRRDGLVLALGGGVVGDLAGFIAATYLRGINMVQVPTTLLAQVDSSVGGKVGINHPLGKNLIGSIYQPRLVLIDPDVLKTLDKRELWAGLAEVVKYGLIADENFFTLIEKHLDEFINLTDSELTTNVLAFCCQTKANVVEQDEKESGLRRILNFGHTIGHAIEAVSEYSTFRHGEAIIHGMNWASWVSYQKGMLSENEFQRIIKLLYRFPIPSLPENIDTQSLNNCSKVDKKQSEQGLNLVLLEAIGRTRFEKVHDLTEPIKTWLQYVKNQ
jgi:3-dehydroquinate synthase